MSAKRQGHVLFCSDDGGFSQLIVALYSLLSTADEDRSLRVSILTGNGALTEAHRQELRALVGGYRFVTLEILDIDSYLDLERPVLENPKSPWSIMTWSRCLVGKVFGSECSQLVYLDIDVQVSRDLGELYDLELGDKALAAVYENAREDGDIPAFWESSMISAEAERYFNAGVLVMNVKLFREEDALRQIVSWYAQHRDEAIRMDQDALNSLFWDRTIRLHPRYNYCDGWCERQLKYSVRQKWWRGNPPREVLESIVNPAVIHFWGRTKPWRWNHRPEGYRYEAAMREVGLLVGNLPDTTIWRRMTGCFFAKYHAVLRKVAIWRIKGAE